MSTRHESSRRSHPRVRVAGHDEAALHVARDAARFEIWDISMVGVAFVIPAGERPRGLAVGRPLERILLRIGGGTVHGEVVPTHVTPAAGGALVVGARLYPATEADHETLTRAVAGLEHRGRAATGG